MSASLGKHKRNDNASSRKQQFGYSTTRRRGKHVNGKDEQNKFPYSTTLYDLPLEMLDIILQKSYLKWIFHSSTKQRDEEVIRSLISVDVCFSRRITRKRFKKAIWRHLKKFYRKTQKISAIIRSNRNYLLENIQPHDELIALLLCLNCITEEQSHFIQRNRSNREKNAELLYVMRSFDETKFSNFMKSLRQSNQRTVARIIENGGGVIKIEVQTRATCTTSMETQKLHQKLEDLRNRTTPWSHQTDKHISQLREEGIEILNSQLDRQTVVVWIWCRLQAALEHIQRLYISNELIYVFFENIQPSTSKVINIDRNQFKKTVVVCPISINFTQRIEIRENEYVLGVTKLRNEIYVLCQSYFDGITVIRVFHDRNPFRVRRNIKIKQIKVSFDIVSSEKENCLYVSDRELKCVWKITRERSDAHKIIKWLTTDYEPFTLSVSSDGRLLVVSLSSSILMIYGLDAELIRSIQLPRDIKELCHAVETSSGNFIILHYVDEEEKEQDEQEQEEEWMEVEIGNSASSVINSFEVEEEDKNVEGKEKEWMEGKGGKSGSSGRKWERNFAVSEMTRDGQLVIRRFVPSNETQELNDPRYLSLDSDDQVFVSDCWDGRVILLDYDLKWNRILCPTKEEAEETKIRHPWSLCYDEEEKQLIVGGYLGGVNVYTLSRN